VTGSYVQGQIINVTQIGVTQMCDFTNTTSNSQTYTQNSDGTYSPVLSLAMVQEIKLAALKVDKADLLGTSSLKTVGRGGKEENANNSDTNGDTLLKDDKLVNDFLKAMLTMFSKSIMAGH
jgi:hypothetical protein